MFLDIYIYNQELEENSEIIAMVFFPKMRSTWPRSISGDKHHPLSYTSLDILPGTKDAAALREGSPAATGCSWGGSFYLLFLGGWCRKVPQRSEALG